MKKKHVLLKEYLLRILSQIGATSYTVSGSTIQFQIYHTLKIHRFVSLFSLPDSVFAINAAPAR